MDAYFESDDYELADNRLADRAIDEFLGHCRFLAAKRCLEPSDIATLQSWLGSQKHVHHTPLVADVSEAILNVSRNNPSEDALREIHSQLSKLVGGNDPARPQPSSLPLNDPPPVVAFKNRRFCFTGTFDFGKRDRCIQEVHSRGGWVDYEVTNKTDYLVIGSRVTKSWKHSALGNKIMAAAERRADGRKIAIISEEHWREALTLFEPTRAMAEPPKPGLQGKRPTSTGEAATPTPGSGQPRPIRTTTWGRRAEGSQPSLRRRVRAAVTLTRRPVWLLPAIAFWCAFVFICLLRR